MLILNNLYYYFIFFGHCLTLFLLFIYAVVKSEVPTKYEVLGDRI